MDKQSIFGQNKILNHPDKIQEWLNRGDRTLITFELHMSNACNNRCPKCSGWKGKEKKGSLTLKDAKDYLTQAKRDLGAKGVIFSGGGEPLVNPDTIEALHYAKSLGLDVGLITNGKALNRKNMTDILATCTWCRISIDAGDSKMYTKTHGMKKEDFGEIVVKLKHLCTLRDELKSNCIVGSAYLTGKEIYDYNDMETFVEFSKWAGVNYAQFRPFHYDMFDVSGAIKKLQRKYGQWVTGSWQKYSRMGDRVIRPYDVCYGIDFATVIAADHNVYICCHLNGNLDYSMGDLRKKSLKDIWKNRDKIRKKIDFKKCPPFCRCDEFNRILFELKKPKQHINFL